MYLCFLSRFMQYFPDEAEHFSSTGNLYFISMFLFINIRMDFLLSRCMQRSDIFFNIAPTLELHLKWRGIQVNITSSLQWQNHLLQLSWKFFINWIKTIKIMPIEFAPIWVTKGLKQIADKHEPNTWMNKCLIQFLCFNLMIIEIL